MTSDAEIDAMIARLQLIATDLIGLMLAALKAERMQPVKTLREIKDGGHMQAWVWIGNSWNVMYWTQNIGHACDNCPAIPIILPAPLESNDG